MSPMSDLPVVVYFTPTRWRVAIIFEGLECYLLHAVWFLFSYFGPYITDKLLFAAIKE